MGVFKKRDEMVDVVLMAKRGMIKTPKQQPSQIKSVKDGFVELNEGSTISDNLVPSAPATTSQASSVLDFWGNSTPSTNQTANPSGFATETDGYNKREVDAKIERLDNQIYKLEQRLEVLERKVGVNQSW